MSLKLLDDQISCMTPDCRVVLVEQLRLAERLEVHSLRPLSVPSFSFLGHDSFLIYGRRTTERTNEPSNGRRTKPPPFPPSFLPSAAAELPRCSLGCLGNDLTCLPLSPFGSPKAFKTCCERSIIHSRNLYSIILFIRVFLST